MEAWFSNTLIDWYEQNKRDLPWRNTTNPYEIWLSEIILQQTQVLQGLEYYQRFIEHYPTVQDLAAADQEQVLKLWQGLGYYARARNLHTAAKEVVEKFGGSFPNNHNHLLSLKGVGDYTAAAIASFAFKQPYAVVDGNVYRFLSRLFGISEPIDGTQGKRIFSALATELLNQKRPDIHNQAIMEFGSQYCKVQQPDCPMCVFGARCQAFKSNTVSELPVKSKKIKVSLRYFHYLIVLDKDANFLIRKRGEGDIWQGMYEFYCIEGDQALEFSKLKLHEKFKALKATEIRQINQSKWYKHQLSHQLLNARFYTLSANYEVVDGTLVSDSEKMLKMPLPRLITKYLEDQPLKEKN